MDRSLFDADDERARELADFHGSGNLASDPITYELENAAIERDGALDAALQQLAPWLDRDLLDVGCGNGYWLPGYAKTARSVLGVEPAPALCQAAVDRVSGIRNVEVRRGSAESLPLGSDSVDVAHARFAYFFGEGAGRGLDEIRRVLKPGGIFAAVDNDWGWGDFAAILKVATTGNAAIDPDATDAWWAAQGAVRTNVRASWQTKSADELDRILRLEFPGDVVDDFHSNRVPGPTLSYGVAIFTVRV